MSDVALIGFDKRVQIPCFNYAHNSDFTQFVAQAGIGGLHGNQAYAGDRWILDSGTVTGEVNENGNGYTNITLNGTIRQIVANPPDVGTAAIEMVSGTADISYANGEIRITSAGGVIKNVALYEGKYGVGIIPKYQPKGYGAELAECMRYFQYAKKINSRLTTAGFISQNGGNAYFTIPIHPMRIFPTILSKDLMGSIRSQSGYLMNSEVLGNTIQIHGTIINTGSCAVYIELKKALTNNITISLELRDEAEIVLVADL